MAALRAYPDPDPETSTFDGAICSTPSQTDLAAILALTSSTAHRATTTSISDNRIGVTCLFQKGADSKFDSIRGFVLFDTSAVSTDTVSTATLSLYATAKADSMSDAYCYFGICDVTTASNTTTSDSDYNISNYDKGNIYDTITYANITTSAHNEWVFDATGRGNINGSGVTKLAILEGHLIEEQTWGGAVSKNVYFIAASAETTGTTSDPVLNVTHGTADDTVASFYPDPDTETTTVDGDMSVVNASWNTAHDSTTSTAADSTTTILIRSAFTGGSTYNIYRAVTGFDTSSVGTDTVSEAEVSLSVNEIKDEEPTDSQSYIAAVGATLASNTAVASGDFDGIGDAIDNPTKWSADIDLGSLTTTQYQFNTIPLNATGISNINGSGVTNIGWREGHDIEDTVGGLTTAGDESHYWAQSADFAGTVNDPVLVVSHGAAASTFTPKVMFF